MEPWGYHLFLCDIFNLICNFVCPKFLLEVKKLTKISLIFLDKVGRRWGLIGNALPFLIGSALMGTAAHKTQLLIGRIIAGIGVKNIILTSIG